MASVVLLLSELLGGESASVLAAERYMGGHHRSLGEFRLRPAVLTEAKQGRRLVVEEEDQAERTLEDKKQEESLSFEDMDLALAVSRIVAVDIMWP